MAAGLFALRGSVSILAGREESGEVKIYSSPTKIAASC